RASAWGAVSPPAPTRGWSRASRSRRRSTRRCGWSWTWSPRRTARTPKPLMKECHMCLGIPGEVIEFLPEQPDLARVDVSGVRRVINVGLLADAPPEPGDWVLIHVA